MKRTMLALAVALVGAGLVAGSTPAFSADDEEKFCPMGGTLIKVEVDKDKAIAWGKDRRKAVIKDEDADTWTVLTLSTVDDDIAILVKAGGVYFGVAGKGREMDERDAVKAFGNDLGGLKDSVKKEIGDLRKADVVKIDGSDVQALSDAAGLGVLRKDGSDWKLRTRECKPVDLDTSEL